MGDPDLERRLDDAILEALQPRSLRERLSWRFSPGLSAIQVLDRLPAALCGALERSASNPVVARRESVDAVATRLRALVLQGRLQRAKAQIATDVRVKGIRLIEVDVFSLR